MARKTKPVFQRVTERLTPGPNGCLLWPGATSGKNGYGIVGVKVHDKWTMRTVHRVVWEGTYGPIPDGMEIDHLCRTRLCANPDHLEVVAHAENQRRMAGDVCPNGHIRTEETTRINANGARICVECRREAVRKHRRSKARQAGS